MSRAVEFLYETVALCVRLGAVRRPTGTLQSEESNDATPTAPGERAVVLVVDDDAGVRDLLRAVLDEEYAVIEAAHGRAALELVLSQPVDLVLLDILMPDVDGLEILQEIKALAPNLPVVMLTAVKTVRTTVAAMKLGAADYLTKPFQQEELLATIRRVLEEPAGRVGAPAEPDRSEREAPTPRTHRILFVGGTPGWRATLAVALERVASVETSATLVDGLNRVLKFRPTCVVLNVGRSTEEAARFLGALNAQSPACPVLVVCDDAYLGEAPVWEALNIRGVVRPPVNAGDLMRQVGSVLPLNRANDTWPQLGESVSRTVDYLGHHFAEDLTVEGIAEIIDISSSHLAHLFRSEIGVSVRDYLTRVRVAIAQDLLANTDEKLESIAAQLGFADTSHLTHVFQRITGRPPGAYRRSAG
jgi:DNA-binding NtrC family response regulator